MSSPGGIFRVCRRELNDFADGKITAITSRRFGKDDGLKSAEAIGISVNTAVKTPTGELWFATKNGIVIFQPGKVRTNKNAPRVFIEKVTVNGTPVPVGNKIFRPAAGEMEDIKLYFSTPLFELRKQAFFKYKLDGYDSDWTLLEPRESRKAEYRNLPPGKYKFLVTACNSDGIWSKKATDFTFIIPFVFLKSILFKMLVLTLLIVSAAVFLFYRQKAKLEKKYTANGFDKSKADACITRLRRLLEKEKVYRDDSITLESLAKQLNTAPWYLSRVINYKLEKSFFDLINHYRVEEVKKRLQEENSSLSILDIAYDVGFNTKSSFNRAFRKFTRMTPSQYRREFLEKKRI